MTMFSLWSSKGTICPVRNYADLPFHKKQINYGYHENIQIVVLIFKHILNQYIFIIFVLKIKNKF